MGEALVSFLDEKGRPGITERVLIVPPISQIGPITREERKKLIDNSIVAGVYEKTLDRESAYEIIKGRVENGTGQASSGSDAAKTNPGTPLPPTLPPTLPKSGSGPAPSAPPAEESGFLDKIGGMLGGGTATGKGRTREGVGEAMAKSAARAIGSQVGREILRGVLGSILGKRR